MVDHLDLQAPLFGFLIKINDMFLFPEEINKDDAQRKRTEVQGYLTNQRIVSVMN